MAAFPRQGEVPESLGPGFFFVRRSSCHVERPWVFRVLASVVFSAAAGVPAPLHHAMSCQTPFYVFLSAFSAPIMKLVLFCMMELITLAKAPSELSNVNFGMEL